MTDYDTMKAGWKMDALVTEMVFGERAYWTEERRYVDDEPYQRYIGSNYSADIAEAWLVVEKLMPTHKLFLYYLNHHLWEVSFQLWSRTEEGGIGHTDIGDTPALAICRAALKTVELDDSHG